MADTEFIIALTEHRNLGSVFVPYLIQREEQYFKVVSHVKPRDFKTETSYLFKPYERELVEIIEKYSDERLMKKFSRAASVNEFYTTLKPAYFQKNIAPFIGQCMFKVASILMLSPVRLLNKEVKYANLYDEDEIQVQSFFARPVFYFDRTATDTRYRLKIMQNEKEIPLLNRQIRIVAENPGIILLQGKMYVFEYLNAKKLVPFLEKEEVIIPRSVEEKYYSGFILNTVRDYEVHASGFTVRNENVARRAVISLEKNLKYEPCLILSYQYGTEKFLTNSTRKMAVSFKKEDSNWLFSKVMRDFDWETNILLFFKTLDLKENNGSFSLPAMELLEGEQLLYFLVNWINRNKPRLDEQNIVVSQENLDKKYFMGLQSIDLETRERGDWFDVYATVRFGEFTIPFLKLKKYILNDIRELELPNGEIAILPEEWFTRYKGILPLARFQGDKLQFEKHHFLLLKSALGENSHTAIAQLEQLENPGEAVLPANLNATLRSYQHEGYGWMLHLQKNGFGGCLADDMGLGKTLQTLALLLKLKRAKQGILINQPATFNGQLDLFGQQPAPADFQPASLVVLPTSLVHNWDNEIAKFTSTLKTWKYVGSQRKKAVDFNKIVPYYDVILTTYGTVRNDISMLRNTCFFYIILDESQFIKNPASKTYKAMMQLRASHRLVLTGTPIENSLADLWAQMNFLNPGLLGNQAWFQKTYITPVEKQASGEQQNQLQLLIRPFILRRRKSEVAKDLPPLTEQVVYCKMADEQEKLYETEKSAIRNAILENIDKQGVQKSSLVVLQGLTKLRQLANHPSLIDKDSEENSGKFDQIMAMLENLVAEKHKVLIFSSFVTHLKLIEKYIQLKNWNYSLLTGKTTHREAVINRFQEEADNHIFLISLKAGGVGLNLTEAGYVFIIDPWWNPAAENQAINRAHRIGQDKQVFVYRFITENSIEEKIQLLKERKTSLADKFINSNNPFKEISRDEIMDLFK